MSNDKVTPLKQRPNVKPTMLPALVLSDEKKVKVVEHNWDGKSDRFSMFVDGQKAMVNVHMRQYQFNLAENRKAVTYVLADDRLSDDQLRDLVSAMGPWFYTYGMRIES